MSIHHHAYSTFIHATEESCRRAVEADLRREHCHQMCEQQLLQGPAPYSQWEPLPASRGRLHALAATVALAVAAVLAALNGVTVLPGHID